MTVAGGRKHRSAGVVTASDLLPTAGAVDEVKRYAAQACCGLAAGRAWPDLDAAKACVDLIPYVALAALNELCAGVKPERLARCLGLDPLDGTDELARRMAAPSWPSDAVAAVVAGVEASR